MTQGSPPEKRRIAVLVGTRPEAIKMAPVVRELRSRAVAFDAVVVATGQHPFLLRAALDVFDLVPDRELELPVTADLSSLGAALLSACGACFSRERFDAVLVQGDTASAAFGAVAAFYQGLPVGHVEAGLRTGDIAAPFPEEAHRRLVAPIARWSFCPTESARGHLLREGIPPERVWVTGNTVVDAVEWLATRPARGPLPGAIRHVLDRYRTVLVTTHRRENLPGGIANICRAIARLVREHDDLAFVFPVHLNPRVRDIVGAEIGRTERVVCCEPQPYDVLAAVMRECAFVLTDSGGLQEEAPSFGRRVVLCRENTERPEGVAAGTTLIAGTRPESIVASCRAVLTMAPPAGRTNPFGDGRAATRVCDVLADTLCAC